MSNWQLHLPTSIRHLTSSRLREDYLYKLTKKELNQASYWFLATLGSTMMVGWDGKLVFATGMGVGTMILVYQFQRWHHQMNWQRWQQFFQTNQGKLTLAVVSGSIVTLSTYLVASVLINAENRWLMLGSLLQGGGILLTLGLVSWQWLLHYNYQQEKTFEHFLDDLTASDPLKRLIAVRELNRLVQTARWQRSPQLYLQEYLEMMFTQEQDHRVRQAILESLQRLKVTVLARTIQPLQIPLPRQSKFTTSVRVKELVTDEQAGGNYEL